MREVIVKISITDKISVSTKEIYFWYKKDLDSRIWKEELKASIKALTPFVEKYKAKTKPTERSPPLGLFTISSMVLKAILFVDSGKTLPKSSINVFWNPSIGM